MEKLIDAPTPQTMRLTPENPLALALKRDRDRYNSLFATEKRNKPSLDAALFNAHLLEVVKPIVESVHKVAPGRVDEVTRVLFELSLNLVGSGIAGKQSRHPAVNEGWLRLLPFAILLTGNAKQIAASITNALYQLSLHCPSATSQWIDEMVALCYLNPSVADFFEGGRIIAWRCGMPHLRERSLEACKQLPAAIAQSALIESWPKDLTLAGVVAELEKNPWRKPAQTAAKELRIVARVGGFRGFGGSFIKPPTVSLKGGHFVTFDGKDYWRVCADAFGSLFFRVQPAEFEAMASTPFTDAPSVNNEGTLRWGSTVRIWPELVGITSQAFDGITLAVTTKLSHCIYMISEA